MKTNAVLALLLASGCSLTSGESRNDLESQAESHSECCKVEGGEIGQEAILIRLGTKTVLLHDWVGKTGASGEYVGFSLTLGGGDTVDYVVKASGETYPADATTWIHPNGPDGGSSTPGISNVDFCGECDNPDGCDGGGGGDGGGECDNPDGCDGGGDGGPILL